MACERNRILDLTNYLESLGIKVNIGKNKARGNKGFFRADDKSFRIDIAKGQSEDAITRTLIHEFGHFIHYNYDKTLNSLDFIFEHENDILTEELIQLTVDSIPKESISPLFEAKEKLKSEIKSIHPMLIFELNARQKALRRINSRINRLNKYYNRPTELFARSLEVYITDRASFSKKAPHLLPYYDNCNIDMINKLKEIFIFN